MLFKVSSLMPLAVSLLVFALPLKPALDKAIVLKDVTVIDCTGRSPQRHMTVVIANGRIAALGKTGQVKIPGGAELVEASGKFLIPGLWNMHVHSVSYQSAKKSFSLLLTNGITGVRDMGAPLDDVLRLRKEIEEGQTLGPHMVVAGPLLEGGPLPPHLARMPLLRSVSNEEDARQAVISLKGSGVDFVKVDDSLPRGLFFAVAGEARRQNIPFAGHIPPAISAGEASDAGQKSVEHLGGRHYGVLIACSKREAELQSEVLEIMKGERDAAFRGQDPDDGRLFRANLTRALLETYSDGKAAALFRRFSVNSTWLVPTLVTMRGLWNRKDLSKEDVRYGDMIKAKELEVVNAMRRAHVKVMAGTDGPLDSAASALSEELALFVQAGFTPMEALQTATRNPAEFLGKLDRLGTVERGKIADLLLLDANPLEEIGNTKKIAVVFIAGRAIPKSSHSELHDQ
ncbi:MAG TPA: amidohydrolase family protein [Acidobacteriota bacterium]|nr:amidohydrolase family protein [Acidobacteriota bacterium]